ncbi:hypothetical protein PENSPDRAFT_679226 [Peniophora sp. CONT]|nr:hypothetical protein PENSPDRAFT_679226 [Peniophora sp. CONT]
MPLQPGDAAFRFHLTSLPGIFVLYYGVLAHRDADRNADPAALHPDPVVNRRLLTEAANEQDVVLAIFLEKHCRNMPNGPLPTHKVVYAKKYQETADLGPVLCARLLHIFGETEPERDKLERIANDTIDNETEQQLDALVQILRLGRENPLCPASFHRSYLPPVE